jgi:hypothetical protein
MMWDLAEYIEEKLMQALDAAGDLYEYQAPIEMPDRENWGGRLDIVRMMGGDTDDAPLRAQIVEVKTVRSNSFNFNDRPKHGHVMQATIYDHYYDYPEGWGRANPILWYADRGGSNPPEEYVVEPDFAPVKLLMDELDEVRAALPDLPGLLPKVLKLTNYRKTLKLVPDWRCSYCDYAGLSCHPDTSEETWGEATSGAWSWKTKAQLGVVSEWAEKTAHEAILAAL